MVSQGSVWARLLSMFIEYTAGHAILPVDHAEESIASSRSGPHAQSASGEAGHHSDARCLATDDRWALAVMPRFTQPEPDQAILLHKFKLDLPQLPPPRIKNRVPEFPQEALRL